MEYYSAMKKNEVLKHATVYMNHTNITLRNCTGHKRAFYGDGNVVKLDCGSSCPTLIINNKKPHWIVPWQSEIEGL